MKRVLMCAMLIVLIQLPVNIFALGQTNTQLLLENKQLNPTFNKSILEYDINELEKNEMISIKVTSSEDTRVWINWVEVKPNQSYNIRVEEITTEEDIVVKIKEYNMPSQIYRINTLPRDFPKYTIKKGPENDESKRIYYIAFQPVSNYMAKINGIGETVFYKKTKYEPMNFRKHTIGEEIRYSYLEGHGKNPLKDVGYIAGKYIVLDKEYTIVDEVELIGEQYIDRNLDAHDFIMIEDGHYIVIGYIGKEVESITGAGGSTYINSKIVDMVIQEIKDKKVVFEWKSSDYPELYRTSIEGNDFSNGKYEWADYAHLNSVYIDPSDKNLILSFRHLNQIIKIDRLTGDIIWKLGGITDEFGLTDSQKFSHQHHATITKDGKLLIFDNNNATERSRIIEMELDERNRKITDFKKTSVKAYYSAAMGSVQKMGPDHYIIGWGWMPYGGPEMTEINKGEIIRELYLKPKQDSNYRVYAE